MKKTLIYLYDPLCGWCYGITPTLSSIANDPDIAIEMLPTGLFSSKQPKLIDDDFATFAWSNDQRIASLTGQIFTERYRELVLGDRLQRIDSGPATLALTAVSLTEPTREFETLKAIQHARYVAGQDITNLSTIASILERLELNEAAMMMANVNSNLLEAKSIRIGRAQVLLQTFSARGVPTFIADSGKERWKIDTREIYTNSEALINQLNATELALSAG